MGIHGDKQQKERDWVLNEFKHGKTSILVATDVAARGLDVDDVKFVINYDYPNNSEDYIHRIGRTGRRNRTGTAYTLFTKKNSPKAKDLVSNLLTAFNLSIIFTFFVTLLMRFIVSSHNVPHRIKARGPLD